MTDDPKTPPPDAPIIAPAESNSRRTFLVQGSLAAAAGLSALATPTLAKAAGAPVSRSTVTHHHISATDKTVHWGYFSKKLTPVVEVVSGDFVTIETVTHHANDDQERMVMGDPGVESIF
jgi:tripartite-type tricarboxylate transporter receptor subunit TctC